MCRWSTNVGVHEWLKGRQYLCRCGAVLRAWLQFTGTCCHQVRVCRQTFQNKSLGDQVWIRQIHADSSFDLSCSSLPFIMGYIATPAAVLQHQPRTCPILQSVSEPACCGCSEGGIRPNLTAAFGSFCFLYDRTAVTTVRPAKWDLWSARTGAWSSNTVTKSQRCFPKQLKPYFTLIWFPWMFWSKHSWNQGLQLHANLSTP